VLHRIAFPVVSEWYQKESPMISGGGHLTRLMVGRIAYQTRAA
jgi:hypothetical protein